MNAFWPTEFNHHGERPVSVGEVPDGFHQSAGGGCVSHEPNLVNGVHCVKYIIAHDAPFSHGLSGLASPRDATSKPARSDVCFEDGDHEAYRDLIALQAHKAKAEVCGLVSMPVKD
jgi:hypothetical protein